jgi:hypothetical protein
MLFFEQAEKENMLHFASHSEKQKTYTFQPLLFQFQCIVTTTDTYYRKLIGATNTSYGIIIVHGKIMQKEDISTGLLKEQLENQMHMLDNILRPFTPKEVEKHIRSVLTISDHEYMHQGEMLVMFREANIELPERFSKAWALG